MRALLLVLAVLSVGAATAAAPAPALAAQPGLVTAIGQTVDEAATAKALRARWVRIYIDWHVLQPARGAFVENLLDDFRSRVAALDAAGVKTLAVVSGAPAWASSADSGYMAPRRPRSYARFVRRLAVELPGIDAWEIWNEADDAPFWHGGPSPRAYTRLLRAAYRAIKVVAPRDTVLTTGLVGNNRDFLAGIYRAGGRRSFDGVAVHTATACGTNHPGFFYREPDGDVGRYTFTGYREIRELMVRRGDRRKGIWMTEFGWNTATAAPRSCDIGAWKGMKPMGVTESTQARYLRAAFRCLARDRYVKAAFWFSTQDISNRKVFGQQLGLLRRNGSRKPAARAFRRASRLRGAPCGGY